MMILIYKHHFMGKVIRLTESDLVRIIKRAILEQDEPIEEQVKKCIMDSLKLKDIGIIMFKFPRTFKLGMTIWMKKPVTLKMVMESHEELEENSEYACEKMTQILACISQKNNITIDETTKGFINTVCKTGATLGKTVKDVLNKLPLPGKGDFPPFPKL